MQNDFYISIFSVCTSDQLLSSNFISDKNDVYDLQASLHDIWVSGTVKYYKDPMNLPKGLSRISFFAYLVPLPLNGKKSAK